MSALFDYVHREFWNAVSDIVDIEDDVWDAYCKLVENHHADRIKNLELHDISYIMDCMKSAMKEAIDEVAENFVENVFYEHDAMLDAFEESAKEADYDAWRDRMLEEKYDNR